MAKRSQTVTERIHNLYAVLATIAARKAVQAVREGDAVDGVAEAEMWAQAVGEWLDKSSAAAARWTFSAPGPSTTL